MKRSLGRYAWYVCITASLLIFCPWAGVAQSASADSTSPVTYGGFVDAYFSWNFARPASRTNRLTNFDLNESQFVLSSAEFDIVRAATPVGFRLELATGGAADMMNSGPESARLFQQAYVTLVVPVGSGLTVDAGKFFTHMGYETVKAKDNFNYSRSFLFAWAIPYYHTGIRMSYPLADNLTASVHLCNGWNGSIANTGKTFGAAIAYAPLPPLSIIVNWIGGPEEADSVTSEFRHVLEGLATFKASDRLSFGIDAMYGTERLPSGTVSWSGAALYGRYALTESSALSLRGELYKDPNGFTTGLVQDLSEVTVTYEKVLFSTLILRAEYRFDASTARPFDGSDGDGTRKDQSRAGIACIVTF
jgi:hypothetical protein